MREKNWKVVVAPNSLKGSLSATETAEAIALGIGDVLPTAEVCKLPISDGGNDFLEALTQAQPEHRVECEVTGPLGSPVSAVYLYDPNNQLALIETATANGLTLVPQDQLNPLKASSYGVGELILDAMERGAKTITLGLGGSATNDGGMGMAEALGIRFLDADGATLSGNGENLALIHAIDLSEFHPQLNSIHFQAVCDVINPLLGADGATFTYGPQKGADHETLQKLESGLAHLATLFNTQLEIDVTELVSGGAAGGLGAALFAWLDADLLQGAEWVLEQIDINSALNNADLLITAEGALDNQTGFGKAPAAVASRAKKAGVPCIALAGQVTADNDGVSQSGINAAFSICPGPIPLDDAMKNAARYLRFATSQVLNSFISYPNSLINSPSDHRTHPAMIKKCIFPAAGYGTRFLPATKAMPKEVMPILDKPLIQYGVEEAMDAGMTDIGIITGRAKRAIEDHFDINYELEHQINGTPKEALLSGIRKIISDCTFSYTRQIEMLGLGHAILTAETLVGHEPFGVILADDLCINQGHDGIMQQMIKVYEKYRCSIVAIEEVSEDEVHKYGVIDASELDDGIYKINGMVEKPSREEAPSNLAIIGRYILTPEIFDIIRRTPPGKNGELQITDSLQIQAQENMVLAYRFQGRRFDCGSVDGFVDATNYFYQLSKS